MSTSPEQVMTGDQRLAAILLVNDDGFMLCELDRPMIHQDLRRSIPKVNIRFVLSFLSD